MSVTASKRPKAGTSQLSRPVKKAKTGLKKPSKRRPSSSSSSHSEDEGGADDKEAMLAALQAHSRALFGMEEPVNGESSEAGRARLEGSVSGSDDEEEDEFQHSDDGWEAEDGFVSDSEEEDIELNEDDLAPARSVPEVVFAPTASSRIEMSKAERRAFLKSSSSKMMGLVSDSTTFNGRKRPLEDDIDEGDHRKLDKSLHEMLLSNLLPTAAVDAASRPVEKRNAMYGRLRELADLSSSGQGADDIRGAERRHHPAKIRTILMKAKEGRDADARKEDIEAGNYVRGLGGLTDGGRKGKGKGRKESRMSLGTELRKKGMDGRAKGDAGRDRGLGMGIGKFKGGMLTLSERDIARGSGQDRRGGGGGKKGGKGKRR